jgi:hypothetical protein
VSPGRGGHNIGPLHSPCVSPAKGHIEFIPGGIKWKRSAGYANLSADRCGHFASDVAAVQGPTFPDVPPRPAITAPRRGSIWGLTGIAGRPT